MERSVLSQAMNFILNITTFFFSTKRGIQQKYVIIFLFVVTKRTRLNILFSRSNCHQFYLLIEIM